MLKPGATIGILGGGQLARMLALAAAPLGLRCHVYSPDKDSCAFDVPWTVAAVDIHPVDGAADDPVINTITIHFHPGHKSIISI